MMSAYGCHVTYKFTLVPCRNCGQPDWAHLFHEGDKLPEYDCIPGYEPIQAPVRLTGLGVE